MKNIAKNKTILTLVVLMFIGALTACSFDFPDREYEKVTSDQNFSFDPTLALASIKEGKTPIFIPSNTSPESLTAPEVENITWQQEDYFQIAEAVHKFVWKETLDSWQLHEMDFSVTCSKAESGFESGHFQFFKVTKNDEGEERIKHQIDIDATGHSIFVSESEYKPKLVDWKTIDKSSMKFSASDSLQIAEKNGGKQKRLELQNRCYIFALIAPDSVTSYQWVVRYTDYEQPQSIFHIEVNPTTGKYQK